MTTLIASRRRQRPGRGYGGGGSETEDSEEEDRRPSGSDLEQEAEGLELSKHPESPGLGVQEEAEDSRRRLGAEDV